MKWKKEERKEGSRKCKQVACEGSKIGKFVGELRVSQKNIRLNFNGKFLSEKIMPVSGFKPTTSLFSAKGREGRKVVITRHAPCLVAHFDP